MKSDIFFVNFIIDQHDDELFFFPVINVSHKRVKIKRGIYIDKL